MTISTEQFANVNVGTTANDGTGDTLRTAFTTVNLNFANISTVGFDANNINVMGAITLDNSLAPSASSDPGTAGQIVWDDSHIYICVATDTWKRANISTW